MEVDGGGLTLVAWSYDGTPGGGGFGWDVTTQTTPIDFSAPYSLGIGRFPITFTEALVGTRSNENMWDLAYKITLPDDFLGSCQQSACATKDIELVFGTRCDSTVRPTAFRFVGYTADTNRFFFRDAMSSGGYGLLTDVWETGADNCSQGGDMRNRAGLIMVR